jgi:hypothetical protein
MPTESPTCAPPQPAGHARTPRCATSVAKPCRLSRAISHCASLTAATIFHDRRRRPECKRRSALASCVGGRVTLTAPDLGVALICQHFGPSGHVRSSGDNDAVLNCFADSSNTRRGYFSKSGRRPSRQCQRHNARLPRFFVEPIQ